MRRFKVELTNSCVTFPDLKIAIGPHLENGACSSLESKARLSIPARTSSFANLGPSTLFALLFHDRPPRLLLPVLLMTYDLDDPHEILYILLDACINLYFSWTVSFHLLCLVSSAFSASPIIHHVGGIEQAPAGAE